MASKPIAMASNLLAMPLRVMASNLPAVDYFLAVLYLPAVVFVFFYFVATGGPWGTLRRSAGFPALRFCPVFSVFGSLYIGLLAFQVARWARPSQVGCFPFRLCVRPFLSLSLSHANI